MGKINGEKPSEMYGGLDKPMDAPRMPTIRLSLKDFPEAEDMKVGEKCSVVMELKLTGLHKEGKTGYATFEAQDIECDNEDDEEEGEDEKSGERPTFTRT